MLAAAYNLAAIYAQVGIATRCWPICAGTSTSTRIRRGAGHGDDRGPRRRRVRALSPGSGVHRPDVVGRHRRCVVPHEERVELGGIESHAFQRQAVSVRAASSSPLSRPGSSAPRRTAGEPARYCLHPDRREVDRRHVQPAAPARPPGHLRLGRRVRQELNASGPVWRAGANATTRIKTELDLEIGGKKVPAGEYSFFIDLKEARGRPPLTPALHGAFDRAKVGEGITWGAYGYKPDMDVVRAPMTVETRSSPSISSPSGSATSPPPAAALPDLGQPDRRAAVQGRRVTCTVS